MNLFKLVFFEKEWNLLLRNYLLTKDLAEKGELLARKDLLEKRISQETKQDLATVQQHYALKFNRLCASFYKNNSDQRGTKRKRESSDEWEKLTHTTNVCHCVNKTKRTHTTDVCHCVNKTKRAQMYARHIEDIKILRALSFLLLVSCLFRSRRRAKRSLLLWDFCLF